MSSFSKGLDNFLPVIIGILSRLKLDTFVLPLPAVAFLVVGVQTFLIQTRVGADILLGLLYRTH